MWFSRNKWDFSIVPTQQFYPAIVPGTVVQNYQQVPFYNNTPHIDNNSNNGNVLNNNQQFLYQQNGQLQTPQINQQENSQFNQQQNQNSQFNQQQILNINENKYWIVSKYDIDNKNLKI